MKPLKTYLIGSIQDSNDPEKCRTKVLTVLLTLGFSVVDPCSLEVNRKLGGDIIEQEKEKYKLKSQGKWDEFDEIMDDIMLQDEIAVISSDFVIVFWDNAKRHGGSVEEIVIANQHNIPIYCVNYGSLVEMNDWILRRIRKNIQICGGRIFPNNKQLLDYLEKTYSKEIKEQTNGPTK